jgi:ABC-2 type transport system permease protein
MKLYSKYLKIHFMSQMTYKTSFILLSIGQFFVPFLIFLSMFFMFERFDHVKGWTFYEVALGYSIIHMGFSLSECFARGLDSFSSMVRTGDFDRLLVRPRPALIQVLGSKFEFTRVGRLLQSLLVMVIAISNLTLSFHVFHFGFLILMIISSVFIFTGIYMLGATLCFWTVEGIELINVFTDGGREMAQYPLSIYKKFVKIFFTYVIPFGAVNYYPLMLLLGKVPFKWIYSMMPLYGILFILPCIFIWSFGVKRYKSTGS